MSRTYFDGPAYEPTQDRERLTKQHEVIKNLMLDGVWRTLDQIAKITGFPPASVSAQLRHLRKPRFGSYIVDRRSLGGGLNEYRVTRPLQEHGQEQKAAA